MSVKSRFRGLFKKAWEKGRKTFEIWTTVPLSYFFIPVNIIQLKKIFVSAMENLKTVFNTLTDDDKYSLLNRDELTDSIQILLSRKQKTFPEFFAAFLTYTLRF